eukprot:1631151-Amphidinium_carterae.1
MHQSLEHSERSTLKLLIFCLVASMSIAPEAHAFGVPSEALCILINLRIEMMSRRVLACQEAQWCSAAWC